MLDEHDDDVSVLAAHIKLLTIIRSNRALINHLGKKNYPLFATKLEKSLQVRLSSPV